MNFLKVSIFCLSMGLFTYCSSSKSEPEEQETTEATTTEETSDAPEATEPVKEEVAAVCVWENISIRKEPSSKSKWLTSLSLGETLTSLKSTAKDSLDNNREYTLVTLADGTKGWALSDFIIEDAKVGVFVDEVSIYKRPDLLTKTDNKFQEMDIIAIKSTEGDWLEVVGKRTGGKWLQTGWVKKGNISESDIDVAVAKFAQPAMLLNDPAKKEAAISEIVNNADLSTSSFIPALQEELNKLQAKEETVEPDSEVYEEEEVITQEELEEGE